MYKRQLYASAEYAQVIREYQSLIAQQQTVPDWAIGWVISSYIALKQIEPALTLIHQHPSWLTSQQNEEHELFYALLDTGQYPACLLYTSLIDDRDLGSLDAVDDSHFRLDSDQTSAVLQALANQRKIEFALNGQHMLLSSAGSREVLRKMDAFQRRTGTADALLDKGDAGDDAILASKACF